MDVKVLIDHPRGLLPRESTSAIAQDERIEMLLSDVMRCTVLGAYLHISDTAQGGTSMRVYQRASRHGKPVSEFRVITGLCKFVRN